MRGLALMAVCMSFSLFVNAQNESPADQYEQKAEKLIDLAAEYKQKAKELRATELRLVKAQDEYKKIEKQLETAQQKVDEIQAELDGKKTDAVTFDSAIEISK